MQFTTLLTTLLPLTLTSASDFYDSFGPIRADKFSLVLFSNYAIQHSSSPTFSTTHYNNIFANITTVAINGLAQPFVACPPADSMIEMGPVEILDATNAERIGLSSDIRLQLADMCHGFDVADAYNGTTLYYDQQAIEDLNLNEDCQLYDQVGGQPIFAGNATGAGVLRCVLDVTPCAMMPGCNSTSN